MDNINTLREQLFQTIKLLKDRKIDPEEAKAIGGLAQVIVNSAKTEIEFLKLKGDKLQESEFLRLNG